MPWRGGSTRGARATWAAPSPPAATRPPASSSSSASGGPLRRPPPLALPAPGHGAGLFAATLVSCPSFFLLQNRRRFDETTLGILHRSRHGAGRRDAGVRGLLRGPRRAAGHHSLGARRAA